MRWIIYILLNFILCLQTLTANNNDSIPAIESVATTEGLPSSLVGGMVCAISGQLVDQSVDVVVPGPEPLIFSRSYCSLSTQERFGISWWSNHRDMLYYSHGVYQQKEVNYCQLFSTSGSTLTYYHSLILDGDKKKCQFKMIRPKGLTNGAGNEISGRTNVNNYQVTTYPDDEQFSVKTGAGVVKHIQRYKTPLGDINYLQSSETKPNGIRLEYVHSKDVFGRLHIIKCLNAKTQRIFSTIRFDQVGKRLHLQTSDNQVVKYSFTRQTVKNYSNDTILYVKDVEKPRFPHESYEYVKRDSSDFLLMSKKKIADKQFLDISYYKNKHLYQFNNALPAICIEDKNDYRIDRVRQLKAPVGPDDKAITTHRFVYDIKQDDNELQEGKTDVYDAYSHKTTYCFTKEHRLEQIRKYQGTSDYHLFSKEGFVWGKEGSSNEGNLICKYLKDGQGNTHQARYFKYDERGNIKKKELWGCLTGMPTPQLQLDKHHIPINNGCEKEKKVCTYSEDGLNHLLTETDSNGVVTVYHYYPRSDLLAAKLIVVDEIVQKREFYTYDQNHVIIKKVIDDGKGLLEYDLTGLTKRFITHFYPRQHTLVHLPERVDHMYLDLQSKQEVLLNKVIYHYTLEGYLAKEDTYDNQGDFCYSKSWEYDGHGNCTKEINPLGEVSSKKYDDYNNLIFQEEPGSQFSLHNTYDYSNRLVLQEEKHTDGNYFATKHRYNYLNQCIATTDPYGQETTFEFDDLGRQIATHLPEIENEAGEIVSPVIHREYNLIGLPTCVTDAKGLQTKIQYNIRGQPILAHYPDGSSEQYLYLLDGTLIQKTERSGIRTHYEKDYQGRILTESTYAAEGNLLCAQHWSYNAFHPLTYIDKEGIVTHYHYDFAGRLVSQIKEDQMTEYFYDSLGREIETKEWIDESNYRRTIKVYDWLNRIIEDRLEDAQNQLYQCNQYTYNAKGNKIVVKAGEQVTKTTYDAHQNVIKITNALGQTTHTAYNPYYLNHYNQRVLQATTTDALGYQTILTYDNANRLVSEKRKTPFGIEISHQQFYYDLNGNQAKRIDHVMVDGKTTHSIETLFSYNENNQLIMLAEAAYTPEQKITHYLYNQRSQKISTTKPNGAILSHTYDSFGYLKTLKSSDGSIDYDYEYTLNGLVKKVVDYVTESSTERLYDQMGRMIQEKLGNGLILAYQYDRLGRAILITLPDQTTIEYQFSAVDLKAVHRLVNEKYSYTHKDLEHNLQGAPIKSQPPGENGLVHYQYDSLDRCVGVASPFFKQTISSEGYDEVGNLLSYETDGKVSSYTYDDFYQLQSEKGHANHKYQCDSLSNRLLKDDQEHTYNSLNQLLKRGDETYLYDPNGNLIEKQTASEKTIYTYDALDRLQSVTSKQKTISYSYDPFNRRLSKKGVKEEMYFHQGQEEIGAIVKGKITELKVLGKGEKYPPVAIELNDQVYVPIRDLFGQISGLQSLQGQLIETYRYSAFGEIQILNAKGKEIKESQVGNPWRYANKRFDPETGFVAFGLRYYDPNLGRWVTADPSGFEDGPNLYAYVHHSPLIYFDQFGLFTFSGLLDTTFDYTMALCDYGAFGIPGFVASNVYQYLNNDPLNNVVNHKFCESEKDYEFFHSDSEIPDAIYYNRSAVYNLNDFKNPSTNMPYNLKMTQGKLLMFMNGVNNSLQDHLSSLGHLGLLANHNVLGVYSASQGMFSDFYHYKQALINNVAYESVRILHRSWNEFFKDTPEGKILMVCHSRAAVYVRNALMDYPPELRKQIQVLAVAPGGYIADGLCGKVKHLTSDKDLIPWLDYHKISRCGDTVVNLKAHPEYFIMDHSFQSPTYAPEIKKFANKFFHE
ncbi:RHS repeat-associated core domain-containing protein [Candidatus Protochlamydia amoebophila]|uniref:Uncharacterized protein n=1 Tax=Protochlamydia amoebophila (strain UWE25) TaxID=264201 RepID=Q6MD86_PARUW|nr:RHS repeat-associated core domain-containing protein [Candidatus Protochlamydia amoebophila]CAF23463.1 unnamed protein product [Candidatus Protochlamydia amoebophila UWE25]